VATQSPTATSWHPRLIEAATALNENRLDVAERILKPHLKEDPFDVRAIRMLAELAARIGRWGDAENLLRRAVELAPGWTAAKANLALVLGRMGRPAEALNLLDDIFAEEPEDLGHWNLKAATLGRLGEFEQAIDLYEGVLAASPGQSRVWLSYGHMLKTVGRQADGVAAYRKAIELRPTLGEAWWSLANLKTVRLDAGDVAAMERALAEPDLARADVYHLHFALGKALEDAGEPERAFRHYEEGNRLRREGIGYDAGETTRQVDRNIALFTPYFFAARQGWGCPAPDPIFILGMPRAGSTLVEQILASHPLVEGTAELPDIPMIARRLAGSDGAYPDCLADLSANEARALGEEYLERAALQRRERKPFFIDKMPNNWVHAGLIHLILPNAKIVDARRHPLDCCVSNFRQHYARGQGFSYSLADMGYYYADYVRLMAHFDAILPGRIVRVVHERLVEEPEAEIRRLLAALGLDFHPACLRSHETKRAVRTASSEQVRRPINRDGIGQWRAYAPWLAPLTEALGPVLAAWPDAPGE
jgi:tetratricopeptide (TPR) repeat protein